MTGDVDIDEDSVVRLAPGVAVRAVDDENGYLESSDGVRRLAGSGLGLLSEQVLPRLGATVRGGDLADAMKPALSPTGTLELLRSLRGQGIIELVHPPEVGEAEPLGSTEVVVIGTGDVADAVAEVLGRTPSLTTSRAAEPVGRSSAPIVEAPDAALLVVVTGSLFEPWCARVNEYCVAERRACLFVGLLPGAAAFVGPLWEPSSSAACFECLRTRIFANSVHGSTWRDYTRSLRDSGQSPLRREVPPWTSARLAAVVAFRVANRAGGKEGARPDDVRWLDEGVPEVTRRLLPVPTCRVCGGIPRVAPEGAAPAGIDLAEAVDDRVGIVHAVTAWRADSGPRIYLAGSTTSDYSLIRPNMSVLRNGGAGFAKNDAVNAAIGESLERYAAGRIPSGELKLASWSELAAQGEQAVHPSAFGLFSAEQYAEPGFPFEPFDEETRVRWARLVRWPDGSRWWLPASQVYLYYRRVAGEASIAPSISTGLAAADSLENAVLAGLCEVLERDALAISWLHRLPPRPVTAETIAACARVTRQISSATTWRVRFYDLSLEFSPCTVAAVLEQVGGPDPVLSFGSACRTSPVRAVEKAFLEAAQGSTYVRRLLKQHQDFRAEAGFGNVDDFTKHAILYSRHPELRRAAGYLVHPDEPPVCERPARDAIPDEGDQLARLVGELAASGLSTYVADLTPPDVRRVGASVCRVVIPGMQHLAGTHSHRLLGNPRLRSVVRDLGYDSSPDNPFPHPLP